jgi:hypothetical protein
MLMHVPAMGDVLGDVQLGELSNVSLSQGASPRTPSVSPGRSAGSSSGEARWAQEAECGTTARAGGTGTTAERAAGSDR